MPHQHDRHVPGHEIREVYITQVLYGVGLALIGVFIPIYLLTLGYGIDQALLFFIVWKAAGILTAPVAAVLNTKIGFKKTTLVRIPFFLAHYAALYALSYTGLHYLVPAVFGGIAATLYWVPLHGLFTQYSDEKGRGSEVGVLEAARTLFKVLAPAVGGVVAAVLGFPVLVLAALAIACLSTVPLFLTPELKSPRFAWRDLWGLRRHRFVGMTVADAFAWVVTSILFPLLIYVSLSSVESVGYIQSLGTLFFALIALLSGKLLDRNDRVSVLRWTAVLFAATIAVRPFFTSVLGLSVVIVLGAIVGSAFKTSYTTLLYDFANRLGEKADEFIVAREIWLNLGRISALALAIIFPWTWGFYFGAAALVVASATMKA